MHNPARSKTSNIVYQEIGKIINTTFSNLRWMFCGEKKANITKHTSVLKICYFSYKCIIQKQLNNTNFNSSQLPLNILMIYWTLFVMSQWGGNYLFLQKEEINTKHKKV